MERAPWCDEAAAALGGIISSQVLPLFREWVDKGSAILWRITGSGWVTWLITRVESFPNGERELVLDAIAGRNARQICRALMDKAKAIGIHSVRFQTLHQEAVAARLIGGLGFKRVATIFEAKL